MIGLGVNAELPGSLSDECHSKLKSLKSAFGSSYPLLPLWKYNEQIISLFDHYDCIHFLCALHSADAALHDIVYVCILSFDSCHMHQHLSLRHTMQSLLFCRLAVELKIRCLSIKINEINYSNVLIAAGLQKLRCVTSAGALCTVVLLSFTPVIGLQTYRYLVIECWESQNILRKWHDEQHHAEWTDRNFKTNWDMNKISEVKL